MTVYKNILFILFAVGFVQCYYDAYNDQSCDDLSPIIGDLKLDDIIGVWYGVEIIHHSESDYKTERNNECFHINIKELPVQQNSSEPIKPYHLSERSRNRHFVLEWHESTMQNDYYVKVNNLVKGFWPMEVPNGSVDKMYSGIIQVLTVSQKYLVLNFCIRFPHSQQYSVVLTRNENQLTPEDLASIHHVFSIKQLSTLVSKRVCDNSSASLDSLSIIILLIMSILSWISQDYVC